MRHVSLNALPINGALVVFVLCVVWASFSRTLPSATLLVGSLCLLSAVAIGVPLLKTVCLALLAGGLPAALLILLHAQSLDQTRLDEQCVSRPLEVEGSVDSLVVEKPGAFGGRRLTFEFVPVRFAGNTQGCDNIGRVFLSYYGNGAVAYGQTWRFTVRLKQPRGYSNPGLHDRRSNYAQRRIDAVGSVRGEGELLHTSSSGGLRDHVQELRQQLRQRIKTLPFSRDVRAGLQALVIADKSGIDDTLWRRISALGINHLFVVSGLHVGFVGGLGFLIGKGLALALALFWQRAHYLSYLLSAVFAAFYVALADFTLPAQRAFVMLVVFLAGSLSGRVQPGGVRLLLAAAVVLLVSPLAGLGVGFWLSFGAVAALLWLSRWHGKLPWWRQWLYTHAYMMLVMLPLGSFFFGGASIVSALANAVMVPVVGLVVVPLALIAALISAVASDVAAWLAWPLWLAAGEVLAIALRGVTLATAGVESALFQHSGGGTISIALGMLACVAVVLPVTRSVRWLLPCLLLPLSVIGDVEGRGDLPSEFRTRVTVLDVGQGAAVMIQRGDRTLLYDTGGGTPGGFTLADHVVLPSLRRAGVRALDTFIVSHGDLDHSAGWSSVIKAMPVRRFRYGPDQRLLRGRACRAGEAWRWPDDVTFRFLSPSPAVAATTNDSSCVLQVRTGPHRLLLTGDIGGKQERELVRYWRDELASDWLLVGHHGSKTSTYWSFLKHVDPVHAVVTAGYANRFGHPHSTVVERLTMRGAKVINTASSGATVFDFFDDGTVQVMENRLANWRHWM